jgi:hypothetical protein
VPSLSFYSLVELVLMAASDEVCYRVQGVGGLSRPRIELRSSATDTVVWYKERHLEGGDSYADEVVSIVKVCFFESNILHDLTRGKLGCGSSNPVDDPSADKRMVFAHQGTSRWTNRKANSSPPAIHDRNYVLVF